jgi:hypothetical protein
MALGVAAVVGPNGLERLRELAPEASAEQLIDPGGGVRGHDRRGRRGGVAVSTEIRLG